MGVIIKRIGLNGSFVQEAKGQSGGIWCLWDQALWKVDILGNSTQHVHMRVWWKNEAPWFLKAVY